MRDIPHTVFALDFIDSPTHYVFTLGQWRLDQRSLSAVSVRLSKLPQQYVLICNDPCAPDRLMSRSNTLLVGLSDIS